MTHSNLPKLTRVVHVEQTSVWAHSEVTEAETLVEMEVIAPEPAVPQHFAPTVDKTSQHVFQQKTVGCYSVVLLSMLRGFYTWYLHLFLESCIKQVLDFFFFYFFYDFTRD